MLFTLRSTMEQSGMNDQFLKQIHEILQFLVSNRLQIFD